MVALLATAATDGLSIYRLTKVADDKPDFVYGVLIIISSGKSSIEKSNSIGLLL